MALNINGTTGISGVDASVAAPALTGTDSNTGISFPSADTIKFSTGGVERISITNSGISGTGISPGGLSMAQQWSISTSGGEYTISSSGDTDITSGWYIANQAGAGSIGSSMTQSSGIFTFPSTGIYSIQFTAQLYTFNPGSAGTKFFIKIQTSTDSGSNYITSTYNGGQIGNRSGSPNTNIVSTLLFDVTDTSTHKVKFSANASQTSRLYTSPGDRIYTGIVFMKLGET